MENKIQQLTEKLYNDGLSKGKQEADKMLEEARAKAAQIEKEASRKADDIIRNAENRAQELTKNTQTELSLSSQQVVTDLKQQIENLVLSSGITGDVQSAFSDGDFVKNLMLEVVRNWNAGSDEAPRLDIMVPREKLAEFEQYISGKIGSELSKGISFSADDAAKTGFKIQPKDKGYYISFDARDFDNLFKEYLRPKVAQMLFASKGE